MAGTVVEEKAKKTSNPVTSIAEMLASAGDISQLFNGKTSSQTTSTSGSTRTSGLDVSPQGVQALIDQILQGTNGLAAVSSGQKGAGLYDSTVNQQLTNDLTSRTAGEVAKATAKTVETTTPSTTTVNTVVPPSLDLGSTLLTAGAGVLGKKVLDKAGGTIEDVLGNIFSGGATAPAASSLVNGVQGLLGSSSGLGFIDNAASGIFDSGVGNLASSSFGGLDFLGSGDVLGGLPVAGIGLDLLSGKPEDALGAGAGYLLGNALIPGVGGPLGSLVSDIIPVGDILGNVAGGIGDAVGGIFGSVVCTELFRQGIMSKELYANDVSYALKHMEHRTLTGYRYWGIPVVELMRKSKVVTRIAAFFAINRAHYIASIYGNIPYKKHKAFIGRIINAVGVPMCNLISVFVTPKDWKVLYS